MQRLTPEQLRAEQGRAGGARLAASPPPAPTRELSGGAAPVPEPARPPGSGDADRPAPAAPSVTSVMAAMEKDFLDNQGIGGIRPDAMARWGFSPAQVLALFEHALKTAPAVDVGQLIMGAVVQEIDMLPGRPGLLKGAFRQLTGDMTNLIEAYSWRHRAAAAEKLAQRQLRMEEVGSDTDDVMQYCCAYLGCVVARLRDRQLPNPMDGKDQTEQLEQLTRNAKVFSSLVDTVFGLTWMNAVWARYREKHRLTEEVVGNG